MKKKRNTKSKNSVLGFFLTLIFLLSCAGGAVWSVKKFYESLNMSLTKLNEKPVATITFKYRTAQRKFEERMIWDRLRQHSPVYDGDTIRTAPGSEATIYFEDGNIMDLGENTMAQVFFRDGKLEMNVSGGSFVVNSEGAQNGAVVKTGTSTVIVSAGSSIGGSVSNEGGTSVKVASGKVVFTDESGLTRAIEEGQAIALDSSGDEQIIPIITVYSPAPNAKILAFGGDRENVDFKWSVQNLGADDGLVLQLSRDKKFESVEKTIDLRGLEETSVAFGEGVSYWRIYPKKAGPNYCAASKLKVYSAPPPSLIAPESRSNYSYKSRLPEVRFSWTTNDVVTAFDLEVADNPQMENPVFKQRTSTPSSIVSTLGTGTWYWRVTPFYALNRIGLARPSETRAFTISQRRGLGAPELILPAANERINTALKDSIVFSWKNDPEAVGYEITIAQDARCYDAKITQKTRSNFFSIKPSEADMKKGTWYWRVTQFDADGDISEQSEVRKFKTDSVKFEQRALYPPDNFVTVDTSLADLRFTWKTNIPGDNKFQIARDKAFRNLVVDEINNEKFYQGARLSGGSYYWRISSASSPDQYSTEPRAFRVAAQLTAPVLTSPRRQQVLTIAGEGLTRFGWNRVQDADLYQFNLYKRNSPGEFIRSEMLRDTSFALDLSRYADGYYAWSVQAIAEQTAWTARRVSPKSEGSFRVAQLRKIKLEYPFNGATIDGIAAMSKPETVRWSCEQAVKKSEFTLSRNANGYSNPLVSIKNPGRAIKLPKLEPGVYYWTVRGTNTGGVNNSPDAAYSFTVGKVAALPKPIFTAPAANKRYGAAEIRASRRIDFVWQPVPNATSYSFVVRNERGQIVLSKTAAEPKHTIMDMAVLKNGRFSYSVQAIQNLPDGTFVRRSEAASGVFEIDLPAAGDIIINDTGVLYGR